MALYFVSKLLLQYLLCTFSPIYSSRPILCNPIYYVAMCLYINILFVCSWKINNYIVFYCILFYSILILAGAGHIYCNYSDALIEGCFFRLIRCVVCCKSFFKSHANGKLQQHRLNMELDLQSLCTAVLIG